MYQLSDHYEDQAPVIVADEEELFIALVVLFQTRYANLNAIHFATLQARALCDALVDGPRRDVEELSEDLGVDIEEV